MALYKIEIDATALEQSTKPDAALERLNRAISRLQKESMAMGCTFQMIVDDELVTVPLEPTVQPLTPEGQPTMVDPTAGRGRWPGTVSGMETQTP